MYMTVDYPEDCLSHHSDVVRCVIIIVFVLKHQKVTELFVVCHILVWFRHSLVNQRLMWKDQPYGLGTVLLKMPIVKTTHTTQSHRLALHNAVLWSCSSSGSCLWSLNVHVLSRYDAIITHLHWVRCPTVPSVDNLGYRHGRELS